MKAKNLIGERVTRTKPTSGQYSDHSYIGDELIILNATDDKIAYVQYSGIFKDNVHYLDKNWCDNNWALYKKPETAPDCEKQDTFSQKAEANYKIIKQIDELKQKLLDKPQNL